MAHLRPADGSLLAPTNLLDLGQQLRQRREIEVALQQGRQRTEALVSLFQQAPDVLLHRRPVGIDLQVRRFIVVAGHVHIDNPFGRQRSQVLAGVVAVVDRIDEQVVDVQQQVAIGLLQYRA
ncbi:hypothetical protein D3C72_2023160 [compost metagenome]